MDIITLCNYSVSKHLKNTICAGLSELQDNQVTDTLDLPVILLNGFLFRVRPHEFPFVQWNASTDSVRGPKANS